MHLTRASSTNKLPIRRKGTKYVARAIKNLENSMPVVIAIREILGMAKTAKEVKFMIHNKLLKINGRPVRDHRESIELFNFLDVGNKRYVLIITANGKFGLEETKTSQRLAKVIKKTVLKKNIVQLNLHDGTNLITKEKVNIGDSVELDPKNKVKKVIKLEKGNNVFVYSGKLIGKTGIVDKIEGDELSIRIDNEISKLNKKSVFVK